MDLLNITDLSVGREISKLPTHVPGRVVHIDADILAYILSAKYDYLSTQRGRQWEITKAAVEYSECVKFDTGSDTVVMHTTPSASTKGGRFNQAKLKVYQGNRKNKIKPKELTWTREILLAKNKKNVWVAKQHFDQEADDGLAQALALARKSNTPELAVICSNDKDLMMVPGLHADWDDHSKIINVNRVGDVWVDSSNKIRGCGFKWFCWQLLAGDSADDISGIPKLTYDMCVKYLGKGPANGGHKLCGKKTAYDIVSPLCSVKDLLEMILDIYKSYGDTIGFVDYSGEKITAHEALFSEIQLLWMRETKSSLDFFRFLASENMVDLWKSYMIQGEK